jgi:uncharacterized protein YbbC (DUF1343 family)
MKKTVIGLDVFEKQWPRILKGAKIGLVCHPASINSSFNHASEQFLKYKGAKLSALFGPQHGIMGETQANMIEWKGYKDKKNGLPIHSLYGQHRKPTQAMLSGLDALVLDLFDVGARYYTYIWTLYLCMEACTEQGKSVVVLDRPNPIDGITVEGPVLEQEYASFVGLKPLAIRHGMTMGEIAVMFKAQYFPKCSLEIVRMQGWKREYFYDQTGLAWVLPSPNMPTLDTALVYPGMCLFEGLNISEGRGTTRPFELFGAPWINADSLIKRLTSFKLPGVVFRPYHFLPTFDKHKGEICHGAFMHVVDRKSFKPFITAVAAIIACRENNVNKFKWLDGPYEYEMKKLPIDILFGNGLIRKQIESGVPLKIIEQVYKKESTAFVRNRKDWLLY